MPAWTYDKDAVKAELVALGDKNPRSGSALGAFVGVSAASANRWLSAAHTDVPVPDRWEGISTFFGESSDYLARVGGLAGQPPAQSEVARLGAAVEALERRVVELERLALPRRGLRAADTGEDPGGQGGPSTGWETPEEPSGP